MATPVQEEAKPEEQNEQLQESQTEEKIEKYINNRFQSSRCLRL